MSKLDASSATILREQIKRIHAAVNDGTLDRDTVNDALAKLTSLVEEPAKDSFSKFTGQDSTPTTTAPVQADAPAPVNEQPKPPQPQG